MKRIKMALMALAAVSSVGGAFASSPVAHRDAQTYYAVRTGANQFHWTTNDPEAANPLITCKDTVSQDVCRILTDNAPSDNSIPSGHTANGSVYK